MENNLASMCKSGEQFHLAGHFDRCLFYLLTFEQSKACFFYLYENAEMYCHHVVSLEKQKTILSLIVQRVLKESQ